MVDQTDLEILKVLEKDSSLPYAEVARILKMKEATVRKRILTLKERGVIKKFTIIVDPVKLGLKSVAIVGLDVDPAKLLEACEKLSQIPEIRYVATSTGDHMIMTEVWAADGKHLSQIISEKIGKIEGVKKVCPALILEKIKE
ncbi:MAG: Lrp/AsnC family transcriptional regulator [Candidatus Freyarchaeota archaeon]|nr:Lrp/AsnC family transcriptional regulator [Candidatus Jordarchaeia archaeon]